jgi:hypothetical protein
MDHSYRQAPLSDPANISAILFVLSFPPLFGQEVGLLVSIELMVDCRHSSRSRVGSMDRFRNRKSTYSSTLTTGRSRNLPRRGKLYIQYQLTHSSETFTHSNTAYEERRSSMKRRISITRSWLISFEKAGSGSYSYLDSVLFQGEFPSSCLVHC